MRFDNAYLTTSSCSPRRCGIIPIKRDTPEWHVKLPTRQIRFTELLREAGNHTVLSGKNHMFGNKDRAFDKIIKGKDPDFTEYWLKHLQERPKDKPFFFWYSSIDAHRPWQKTKHVRSYSQEEVIVPPYLVDTKVTREDLVSSVGCPFSWKNKSSARTGVC